MTPAALHDLLAKVALCNDSVAYKKLFVHFYPSLLSFSTAITHCKQSSEEVVSDVFLKIWNLRETLLTIENFRLYLYVSTKNISLNYLARQKRNAVFSLDEMRPELQSVYFNPEQLLITSEMFRRLATAVDHLPPRCRLVFKLVKEDGLSYKDVAALLQISVKTVEAQMSIALRRLGNAVYFRRPALS